jgi:ankyrin repeat protein
MASPPQQSYAEVASRSPHGDENSPRVLGYSVNRSDSGDSNFAAPRIGPNVRIAELVEESSGQQRSRHGSLGTSSALSSQGPSLASRRPSIAQVLSRLSSSYISDPLSSASNTVDQHPISQYDDTTPSKTTKSQKKKKKSKHRHRKSSQPPGYGDLLASQALSEELPPQKAAEDTPLLAAIMEGDLDRVRKIVEEEGFLAEGDYPSNEVLQTAALAGHETVFSFLLDSGRFDIDGRDARERTALYAATSRGRDSIKKLLISRNAKPLTPEELEIAKIELRTWQDFEAQVDLPDNIPLQREQTIEDAEMTMEPDQELPSRPESDEVDHIYKLAIGSCENIKEMEQKTNQQRESAQRRGEWVKGPLKPSQLATPPKEIFTHQQTRFPGFGFEIPVVEFNFSDTGGHRIVSPTLTVDDLLYGTRGDDVIAKAGSSGVEAICRWYHIPSNHLGWAEDLIRKIYEKRDTREQAKRDIILAREPFSNGSDHDHLDPTLLDPRPQARALRPQCRYMTLERDKAQRLSTALFLDMPFVHWETEENRAEMHHVMEQVRQACKDDLENQNTLRKSPKAKPDIKAIQERRFWSKNEKLLCAYLYNSPPVHPRRTLDQFYYHMLEDTEERDRDQVITRYYANQWKRNHNLPEDDEELKFAFPDPVEPKFSFSLKNPPDETVKLERKTWPSQHSSSISLTSLRNQGTPRSGGITLVNTNTENNGNAKEERHVLMVDQLWMWILDESKSVCGAGRNYN